MIAPRSVVDAERVRLARRCVRHGQPLTPLWLALLLALAEEDLHGYALMQAVEAQTGGALVPGTGSLYAALTRLEDEGLVQQVPDHPDTAADRRRKYFRITESGRHAARAEAQRMMRVVETAREKALAPYHSAREARSSGVLRKRSRSTGHAGRFGVMSCEKEPPRCAELGRVHLPHPKYPARLTPRG